MISLICGTQKGIQVNLFTKQKKTNLWLPGREGERDKLADWD